MDGDVDNWYEVTDAVRPYNVRLFIGGHYHSNRDLRYDGIPGVLMRSNLRDKDEKPGYGIYEITEDSILVYTQRIGEPKRQWAAFSLTDSYYDRNEKAEKISRLLRKQRVCTSTRAMDSANRSRHLLFTGSGKRQSIRWRRPGTPHCLCP